MQCGAWCLLVECCLPVLFFVNGACPRDGSWVEAMLAFMQKSGKVLVHQELHVSANEAVCTGDGRPL